MENTEVYNQLAVLMETQIGSVHGDQELESLENWNSLTIISFMALADGEYGITLSPKSILECRTVKDLANLVTALAK
jgi:acyl carrier protein